MQIRTDNLQFESSVLTRYTALSFVLTKYILRSSHFNLFTCKFIVLRKLFHTRYNAVTSLQVFWYVTFLALAETTVCVSIIDFFLWKQDKSSDVL